MVHNKYYSIQTFENIYRKLIFVYMHILLLGKRIALRLISEETVCVIEIMIVVIVFQRCIDVQTFIDSTMPFQSLS